MKSQTAAPPPTKEYLPLEELFNYASKPFEDITLEDLQYIGSLPPDRTTSLPNLTQLLNENGVTEQFNAWRALMKDARTKNRINTKQNELEL